MPERPRLSKFKFDRSDYWHPFEVMNTLERAIEHIADLEARLEQEIAINDHYREWYNKNIENNQMLRPLEIFIKKY